MDLLSIVIAAVISVLAAGYIDEKGLGFVQDKIWKHFEQRAQASFYSADSNDESHRSA